MADPTPWNLTEVNGALFFTADDATNGRELWKSDGTEAGTVLVRDIVPGSETPFGAIPPYQPKVMTNGYGTLFFAADDGMSGQELWQSDGTEDGTVLVADLIPGSGGSVPRELTEAGSSLFFSAIGEGIGRELWMLPIPEPDAPLLGVASFGALAGFAWQRHRRG